MEQAQALEKRGLQFKSIKWRPWRVFSWETLKALVFHPLNMIMSIASFFVVLGSIISHLQLFVTTALRFHKQDTDALQVDVLLPHCVVRAATTDITIHEFFQFHRDDSDKETILTGVDLHVRQSLRQSSFELYIAAFYFVSFKPLYSTVVFYLGPIALVTALTAAFEPSEDELRGLLDIVQRFSGGSVINESVIPWLISGKHLVAAVGAVALSELAALISHDLMQVVCCEWRVDLDQETSQLLRPLMNTEQDPPSYGALN